MPHSKYLLTTEKLKQFHHTYTLLWKDKTKQVISVIIYISHFALRCCDSYIKYLYSYSNRSGGISLNIEDYVYSTILWTRAWWTLHSGYCVSDDALHHMLSCISSKERWKVIWHLSIIEVAINYAVKCIDWITWRTHFAYEWLSLTQERDWKNTVQSNTVSIISPRWELLLFFVEMFTTFMPVPIHSASVVIKIFFFFPLHIFICNNIMCVQ